MPMRLFFTAMAVASFAAMGACNPRAAEQKADNVEQAAEDQADNLERQADNATSEAAEEVLENQADAVRSTGIAEADDVRRNDPDTNLANGM
jgi:vacuolar-type H+-ATPase subunit E/Vma4